MFSVDLKMQRHRLLKRSRENTVVSRSCQRFDVGGCLRGGCLRGGCLRYVQAHLGGLSDELAGRMQVTSCNTGIDLPRGYLYEAPGFTRASPVDASACV